jgi:eukaryotic-like serine/threonine-protein kinase
MPDAISPRSAADRNLLFGILALQMDFVSRDALIAAIHAWVMAKSKSLGDILLAQKALGQDEHGLLEALVQKHLQRHDNDTEKSLAAVSSLGSVRENLRQIADPDVEASLTRIPASGPADRYQTQAPSAGTPTATGLRFRVLRPHARGGLGEVFVAHDKELHREVALKEIQGRHADDPESRARFLLEAEITGGLEHPGIVPVYGLGHYAEGRPFYAMRFIRGDSLKEAVERFHKDEARQRDSGQRALELRGLLGRFIDVCDAIEYAHSRGVLHRDLKPGNIMLGKYGETLVVDWGLAKPLAEVEGATESVEGPLRPSSMSGTTPTMVGPVIGTPQYMSPEQAAGRLDQLGPASDVYSLGATLCNLLTGKPPFTDADLGTILRKVQAGDFPRPRQVNPDVPAPLEAICLKAMALRTGDRYASPRALAQDVERWLADEPVSAWREPWSIKARRWIGRHRPLVAGAAGAVLVALIGLTVGTILLARANERERQARELAEHNYQLARKAVDRYHTEVSESVLLNEPGMEPLRKKLLEAAREFYDQFVQERRGDERAVADLGQALDRLARITGEIDSETKAIDLEEEALQLFTRTENAGGRSDLAACYYQLGRLYRLTDQIGKAEEAFGKAITAWEQLAQEQPGEDRYRAELARSRLGLGNVCQATHRLDRARELYEQSLAARRELHRQHADVVEYQRDLAVTLNNLARVEGALEQRDRAEQSFQEAIRLQKELVEAHPQISKYQNDLARSEYNLGDWYAEANRTDRAEKSYQEAATLWERLTKEHPTVADFQSNLAQTYSALANVYCIIRQVPRAEEVGQRAVALEQKLADEHPKVPAYQGDLARCYFTLGDTYRAGNHGDKAEEAYRNALSIQEALTIALPGSPQYQADLARTLNNLGLLRAGLKQRETAAHVYGRAVAAWEELVRGHPGEPEFVSGLAASCQNLCNVARENPEPRAALKSYTQALAALEALTPQQQRSAQARQVLYNALWWRAEAENQLHRYAEAVQDWDRVGGFAPEANRNWFRRQHALALARAGDHTAAMARAEELAKEGTVSGEALYTLACVDALAATAAAADGKLAPEERGRLADAGAARGVALLERARAAGYFRAPALLDKLRSDPDLAALRSRPDFEPLLRPTREDGQKPS